jgi:1-deoxy-D-xylulose-5-phosphate reductoisomerase
MAQSALASGPAATTIFNAANEQAVAQFLEGGMTFGMIPKAIAETLSGLSHRFSPPSSLEEVFEIDRQARAYCGQRLKEALAR